MLVYKPTIQLSPPGSAQVIDPISIAYVSTGEIMIFLVHFSFLIIVISNGRHYNANVQNTTTIHSQVRENTSYITFGKSRLLYFVFGFTDVLGVPSTLIFTLLTRYLLNIYLDVSFRMQCDRLILSALHNFLIGLTS